MFSSVIERLNERRHAAVDTGVDSGFTLIELMVVLLILAILLAIAIPTFLGVTGGANDRAAQSNLNTALTNAKSTATQNNQSYSGLSTTSFKAAEPSLNWVAGTTNTVGQISTYVDTAGNGVILAAYSKNANTCWYAVDNIAPVTDFAAGPYNATNPGAPPTVLTTAPTDAGTYYGKGAASGSPLTCNAAAAFTVTSWTVSAFPA
jgi:type IV pilus assembly protein PilA